MYTYTGLVKALERGEVPEWAPGKQQVPNIAKQYWRLSDDATSTSGGRPVTLHCARELTGFTRSARPRSQRPRRRGRPPVRRPLDLPTPLTLHLLTPPCCLNSFVNHTLGNLEPDDLNPTSFKHASATVQGTQAGFSREESIAWAKQVEEEMTSAKRHGEEEMRRLEEAAK